MKVQKNESGYYEATFKDQNGRRRSFSTKEKSRERAMEILEEARIADIEKAAEIGLLRSAVVSTMLTGERMTVEKAIEPWKEWMRNQRFSENTIAASVIWVTAWAKTVGALNKMAAEIQIGDVDAWVNSPGTSNKMNTRKVMLSAIRSFFSFVTARGWAVQNPAALVKVDPWTLLHEQKEVKPQPIFQDEEIEFLLNMTSPDGPEPSVFWHAAIAISRWAGLRLGDIASLEWSCLAEPGKIMVWTQKQDRRVSLPITPEIEEALRNLERKDPTFIFPEEREISRDPARRTNLSNTFRRLCKRAGLKNRAFHGLRATCATDMAGRGVPIEDIQAILGHAAIEMTQHYIRPAG